MLLLSLLAFAASAQGRKETDGGAALAFEVEKECSRFFSVSAEEEVRLISNRAGFERSETNLGLNGMLLDRKVKIGAYYAFIYLYNADYLFEARHRLYLNVIYKETFEPFTLSWRGRLQGTLRDENRGAYRVNPRYAVKNRIRMEYAIWGSPWKPAVSCEFSNNLNDPESNSPTRIRYQGDVSWRLNRTDYLDFFLRFDQYTSAKDPDAVYLGIKYKLKL